MFSIKPPLMFGTATSTTKRREFVAVSAEDKKMPRFISRGSATPVDDYEGTGPVSR